MLAAGIHPKVVSERLGHSTVAITLDIYSHVIPGLQAEAVKVMDNLLGQPGWAYERRIPFVHRFRRGGT
jgi:integrase